MSVPHDWIFRAAKQPLARVRLARREGQHADGRVAVARRLQQAKKNNKNEAILVAQKT